MERKIELYGSIGKNNPIISGKERLNEFLNYWKGKKMIMELIILDAGSVDHHVWYILKMIVPAWIRGHRQLGSLITPEQALDDMYMQCPAFALGNGKTEIIFNWKDYKVDCKMNPLELEYAIEWLHIYCADNFNIIIGNTKTIQNEKKRN